MNFLFVGNQSSGEDFEIPVGGIVLWYGTSTNLPNDYEIFSSAKNVFVMGASSGQMDLTIAGSATHSHTMPNTSTVANHTHTITSTVGPSSNNITDGKSGSNNSVMVGTHTHPSNITITSDGGHFHTIGNTQAVSNIRQYYRLYWIRRKS